jgi:PAS domain S-box-containing protein
MSGAGARVQILHLEDDAIDADLVAEHLRAAGIEFDIQRVWTAYAFTAALQTGTFDIILADYQLPAFDGAAALRLARKHAFNIPFIYVSGAFGEELAVEAMRDGATDYVVKQRLERLAPVTRRALSEADEKGRRRSAEEEVHRSEARFAAILDATSDWVALIAVDGTILLTNAAGAAMLGAASGEIVGRSIFDFLVTEHQAAYADLLSQVCGGRHGSLDFEITDLHGARRQLECRAAPFALSDGTITQLAVSRDVTARVEAERELRSMADRLRHLNADLEQRVVTAVAAREEMNARLRDAQRLEAIGQLTGGIAHDFNNLLTPILVALDTVRRHISGEARLERLVGGALQAADRAKILVQRLLAYSRRQVLDPRSVDIATLVNGMQEMLLRSLTQDVRLDIETPKGLPPARVDPTQLELGLLNLVVNARDAMPSGGLIRICVDQQRVGPAHPAGLRFGLYIRIVVVDNGVGMDPETLRRAVEPFYSTKGVGKGTGLGLSMMDGLAAQSGGRLLLTSTRKVGTRAEVWLPSASLPAEASTDASLDVPATSRPLRVLLVDDDALVRAAVFEMLHQMGHEVSEAASGAEALTVIRAGPAPDLVVTDYLMPGMNGADLAAALRREYPRLPIIIATGYANLAGSEMADLPLLGKPFRQSELAAVIEQTIEGFAPDPLDS